MHQKSKKIKLQKGDTITFEATISNYLKGTLLKNKKDLYHSNIEISIGLYGIQHVQVN